MCKPFLRFNKMNYSKQGVGSELMWILENMSPRPVSCFEKLNSQKVIFNTYGVKQYSQDF